MAKRISSLPNRVALRIEPSSASHLTESRQLNEVEPQQTNQMRMKTISALKSPRLLEKRLRRGRRLN